jgi:hypothetical protein
MIQKAATLGITPAMAAKKSNAEIAKQMYRSESVEPGYTLPDY